MSKWAVRIPNRCLEGLGDWDQLLQLVDGELDNEAAELEDRGGALQGETLDELLFARSPTLDGTELLR